GKSGAFRKVGRVERRKVRPQRDLQVALARLDPRQTEPGSFGNEREVCNATVRREIARANFFRMEILAGQLASRLAAGFMYRSAHQQIALTLGPWFLTPLGGDKKGPHGPFVVADAFPKQQTVVPPGAVKNLFRGIGMDHVLGARPRRVHVAVEDHAVATAGAV